MADLFQKIKDHPIVASVIAVVATLISGLSITLLFWSSFNVQDPLIPTVWAKVSTMHIGYDLLWLVPIFGLALSLAVIVAVVVSAVQNKREVERLTLKLDVLTEAVTDRERRLDQGELAVHVQQPDDVQPIPDIGRVFWRADQASVITAGRLLPPKQLASDHENLLLERERLVDERDEAIVALKNKKEQYASNTLYRCSQMRYQDGEPLPRVTIRFASYTDDRPLVEKIQYLIDDRLHWPVKLESTEQLTPNQKCKVVFVGANHSPLFGEVAFAISEGDYLGVAVCANHDIDFKDERHLVINVLPS